MRSLPLYGIGFFFVLVGAGLLALSLRRTRPTSARTTKSEQREQMALRAEARKMRIAAGVLAGLGVLLILIS